MAWRKLSADDIFISYSRKDANVYAVGLANELTQKGFSCFFDRLGTEANANLPASLIEKIKGCTMFVLVGTQAAASSKFVAQEISAFTEANGTARIVPIDFDGQLGVAGWHASVAGIAPEFESAAALKSGDPSDSVINRIEKSFNYTRSKDRLRKYTVGATALLAALGLAIIVATVFASQQLAQARTAQKEAADAGAAAKVAKEQLVVAQQEIELARGAVSKANADAKTAGDTASRQTELARQAGEKAEQQQGLARTATAEAQKQQGLAQAATLAAGVQQKRAAEQLEKNRRLVYADSVRLAQQMYEVGNIAHGRNLLAGQAPSGEDLFGYEWRYLSRLYKREVKSFKFGVEVKALAFSPDGKTVAMNADNNWVYLRNVEALRDGGDPVQNAITGHSSPVTALSFSADGEILASADSERRVKLWDMKSTSWETGGQVKALDNHPDFGDGADMVLFSPDGKTLALRGMQGAVELWDVDASRKLTRRGKLTEGVLSMAFSPPDGKLLVASHGDSVYVWDAVSQACVTRLEGIKGYTKALAFSRDGKLFATGGEGGAVKLWETDGWREVRPLEGHTGYVHSVAFSRDGKVLASGGNDASVKLWDVASGRELATYKGHEQAVNSVAFSPLGDVVASGSDDETVKFWDVSERGIDNKLEGHEDQIVAGALSPDGKLFASGSYDKTVRLWDTATGTQVSVFKPSEQPVLALTFSNGSGSLLTGGKDGVVRLHEVPSGRVTKTFERDVKDNHRAATFVAYLPRGNAFRPVAEVVVSGYDDGTLMAWDIESRERLYDKKEAVEAFSPDGRILAGGIVGQMATELEKVVEKSMNLIIIQDFKSKRRLLEVEGVVKSVAFSPDGRWLAYGAEDGTVGLLDYSTVEPMWASKGEDSLFLVSKPPLIFRGHTAAVTSIAFSRDGKTLATGSGDNTTRLWSLSSQQELLVLRGHTAAVRAVAFSPESDLLITAGEDKTVRLW